MTGDGIAIGNKSYSLLEVLKSVQSVLNKAYTNKLFWVRCEISRITLHEQSGHCYFELIEKTESAIIAQLRGILWTDKYKVISDKFFAATQTKINSGIKVMFQCAVNFHPVHGLSLIIHDIEPAFTLGEMARVKAESIARLKKEGLYDKNRNLPLALLPGRIAVISVATSRGYHDFIKTIEDYPKGFAISVTLFEAILQGENAVTSIVKAIKSIESKRKEFDVIAIIRGGAGDAGLACYDDYKLASTVAQASIPVLSGIGHATNETVVEMVSHKNCITPTAAATFLLEKFEIQTTRLYDSINLLKNVTLDLFNDNKYVLNILSEKFCLLVNHRIKEQIQVLKNIRQTLPSFLKNYFTLSTQFLNQLIHTIINAKKHGHHYVFLSDLKKKESELIEKTLVIIAAKSLAIENEKTYLSGALDVLKYNKEKVAFAEEKIKLLDPVHTLKRGFSITRLNGKAIINSADSTEGSIIETTFYQGSISSIVKKINPDG